MISHNFTKSTPREWKKINRLNVKTVFLTNLSIFYLNCARPSQMSGFEVHIIDKKWRWMSLAFTVSHVHEWKFQRRRWKLKWCSRILFQEHWPANNFQRKRRPWQRQRWGGREQNKKQLTRYNVTIIVSREPQRKAVQREL